MDKNSATETRSHQEDAVLTAMGGVAGASVGICREPEKQEASGVRLPIEVAGEAIGGQWLESCWYEGHAGKCLDGQVGKGTYFQTVIANDRQRVVRVWAQQQTADIWICGRRVTEGIRVRLEPGNYPLLARVITTEEWPGPPGFHFRFDDSSDVAVERRIWQESLRRAKPELERIARYGTRPAYIRKAKALLAAMKHEVAFHAPETLPGQGAVSR